jgi:hypothetical protein
MKIELYDKKGVLLDSIDLGDMDKSDAYLIMDQVGEVTRKTRRKPSRATQIGNGNTQVNRF